MESLLRRAPFYHGHVSKTSRERAREGDSNSRPRTHAAVFSVHEKTCEHFIYQEQCGNPSRIWLCNGQSHANMSSKVMKDLLTLRLTKHDLVCRSETHLACEIQVALNYTAFSVIEISVFHHKYQPTCLACAHLYIGCDTAPMSIPQKVCNRCRKPKARYELK